MNDRLEDLSFVADEGDIEMGGRSQEPQQMQLFYQQVESIENDIEAVKKASKMIAELSENALKATTTEQENELSCQLRPLLDATNKQAKHAKKHLESLRDENEKLRDQGNMTQTKQEEKKNKMQLLKRDQAHTKQNDPPVQTPIKQNDLRVRENICNMLTRNFIDEIQIYQKTQEKYKADMKNKVKRQVRIVKPNATDQEIDTIMRSEGGRNQLYQEFILNNQIETTYAKIASKYEDVLTLEQSVEELHQLFLDFALLAEEQGELFDRIEFQLQRTGDDIEMGNEHVCKAIEHQRMIRKKQCSILLIVVIVAVAVVLIAEYLRK